MKAKETTESFKDERMTGLYRLPMVLQLVPVSASTWWAGVRDGRFPKPVYLSKRVTAWKVSDIAHLIAGESKL